MSTGATHIAVSETAVAEANQRALWLTRRETSAHSLPSSQPVVGCMAHQVARAAVAAVAALGAMR